MTQTEDGCRLTIAGIRRGCSHAVKYIDGALRKLGVGKGWRVYITHAEAMSMAFGLPTKQRLLWSFELNEAVEV